MNEAKQESWETLPKKQVLVMFKHKLSTDDRWAVRGLLSIYALQTQSEQAVGVTRERNGMGFSAFDSEILSSFAAQYKQRGFLSAVQMTILKKKMPKYAGQLHTVAQEKKNNPKWNGLHLT